MTSDDANCVAVSSTLTIPEGMSYAKATLSYGGVSTLPCMTAVRAENAIFGGDSLQASVGPPPPDLGAITLDNNFGNGVGSSLHKRGYLRLGRSDHGGVRVQIESSDPSVALVAPDANTRGLPVIEMNIPNGSEGAVGELVLQNACGASVNLSIPVNADHTADSIFGGGISFDPLSVGTTVVSAVCAGSRSWPGSSNQVVVSKPGIVLANNYGSGVGSGLQKRGYLDLGGSAHGDGSHCQPGQFPGSDRAECNCRGGGLHRRVGSRWNNARLLLSARSAVGSATITASAPGFDDGSRDVSIVKPIMKIYYLASSMSALASDDSFEVYIGVPNAAGTDAAEWQEANGSYVALDVTVTSSAPAVGNLVTASSNGTPVKVQISVNNNHTPSTVASGGVAFHPLSAGFTIVAVDSAGFDAAFPYRQQTVTVTSGAP
jgi:hypothetical protein